MVSEIFFRPETESISVKSSENASSKRGAQVEEMPPDVNTKPDPPKGPQLGEKRKGTLSIASEAILSLAHPNINKGSIVGTLQYQFQPHSEQGSTKKKTVSSEDQFVQESGSLSAVTLKIKRAAAKVDKLRPGLSSLVD